MGRINKDDVFRIMKINALNGDFKANDDDDCSPEYVKEVMRDKSTTKVKLVVEPWPSLIRQGVDAEGRYVEGRYASKQDMCHKEVCEAKTTYTSGGSVVHSTTTSGQQMPILVIRDPPNADDVKKWKDCCSKRRTKFYMDPAWGKDASCPMTESKFTKGADAGDLNKPYGFTVIHEGIPHHSCGIPK